MGVCGRGGIRRSFKQVVAEIADQSYVGTALTLLLAVGFTLTAATIWLVPIVRDAHGWAWALALLSGTRTCDGRRGNVEADAFTRGGAHRGRAWLIERVGGSSRGAVKTGVEEWREGIGCSRRAESGLARDEVARRTPHAPCESRMLFTTQRMHRRRR